MKLISSVGFAFLFSISISVKAGHVNPTWDGYDNLTYFIVNTTPDIADNELRIAIKNAFNRWAPYVPMTFTEVSDKHNTHIKIAFANPGDSIYKNYFDDGVTVARGSTSFMYFNDSLDWTVKESEVIDGSTYNFTDIATHEIGHILGLDNNPGWGYDDTSIITL